MPLSQAVPLPDDGAELCASDKDRKIPGNRAIWVGIFAELIEFFLMFLVYFFARANHPQLFHDGPQKLSVMAGTANTVVMISSSYFVARAVLSMRQDRSTASFRWLLGALVIALCYPLIKFFEIRWNISQGLTGNGDAFQLSYYYLTFNHLVHVTWGIWGLLWVMAQTRFGGYSADNHKGLVAFASYWHATDLIWLMIFSAFYVMP